MESVNDELQFKVISDEPCEECKEKNKEQSVSFPNYTFDELERVIPMLDKYGLSVQEKDLIYNLYNRIFKTDKRPGCGKCFKNISKALKIKYVNLLNEQ